jgi:rubredoxin
MLPPEIGCPRCSFLFKTSAVFCALPALTRCPVCGLTVDELRSSLEAPGPRARLESDLHQLEGTPSQRLSASLEAHLGGAAPGALQKSLGRGPMDRPPRKRAA